MLYSRIKTILHKVIYIVTLNPIIKRTNWYKNFFVEDIYPGNLWYRCHDERNFDLVVLGSSGAKWAFDFDGSDIKAMNWAQQPQTLVEDFNILRNFHSILRKKGVVIITIMPFTGLNKETNVWDAVKYLQVHCHEPIETHLIERARAIVWMPIRLGKPAIKATIKYLLGKDVKPKTYNYAMVESNPMDKYQLDKNAESFVKGWKNQFSIEDFEAPLTEANRKGRIYRIELMRTIIDFCTERQYKPILIVPPVTRHLNRFYTSQFKETYIYSFLREVSRNVHVLDYSNEDEFMDDKLYFNSFFMNSIGRKLFTARVINDLKQINVL